MAHQNTPEQTAAHAVNRAMSMWLAVGPVVLRSFADFYDDPDLTEMLDSLILSVAAVDDTLSRNPTGEPE